MNLRAILAIVAVIGGMGVFAPSAHAAMVFFDDFEDADLVDWKVATRGGGGSTSVVMRNGSLKARASHSGNLEHAIVRDFLYDGSRRLSFDMEANALPSQFGGHAYAGVKISFLTSLNTTLGSFGIYYATSPALLGPRDLAVGINPHDYEARFSELAALAGVASGAPISKLSLAFVAAAQTDFAGHVASSVVHFDNVGIAAAAPVPEPSAYMLLLTGLILVACALRRRRAFAKRCMIGTPAGAAGRGLVSD